jgi:hypothetical protein
MSYVMVSSAGKLILKTMTRNLKGYGFSRHDIPEAENLFDR